jgi:hypothetical protein
MQVLGRLVCGAIALLVWGCSAADGSSGARSRGAGGSGAGATCSNGLCTGCDSCVAACICQTGESEQACAGACTGQAGGSGGSSDPGAGGGAGFGGSGVGGSAGATCVGGLAPCGGVCVDTSMDPGHCGGCGQACENGHLCQTGVCVGPGADGCTETPVTGLSLSAVDAYQTLQIPIMEAGTAVGPSARNVDVVVGRKTVFRVHVTPEAGWTPRQVSARIELTDVEAPDPSQKEVFFALLTPTKASSDSDLSSTFQVKVPAEAIGLNTRYAVTLVECDGVPTDPPPAEATRARFPSQGFEDLAARETGPLKVHIIPISGTNVTVEGLKPFKERLEAIYPITEVQFTIGQPLTAVATSMCSLLASVTSRRSADSPPNDVYYYGLAPGILGGQSGCSTTSTSSRGSKVSAGWAQGYTPDDGRTGAATMCHELGHAHGRFHAPCNVQDPDPQYPYPGANIGVWGYDQRSDEFYEPTRKDMMSYCPEPRWAAWISDYTYRAILARAVEVNAQTETPAFFDASAALLQWRLLVSDSAGVHWVKEPLLVRGTPDGDPMRAVVHGEQGPMQQVVVYRRELEDGVSDGAFMLTLPEPDESWRAIEVPGLLAPQPF